MWKRIPRVILPWVILLTIPPRSGAQTSSSEEPSQLERLIAQALETNAVLNLQRGRYEIANAGREAAAGWPDPMVGAAFAPAPVYTARGTQQVQVRVEQPLPRPGDLSAQRAVLRRTAEAERLMVDAQALGIAYAVRSVYIEVVKAVQMQQLIRSFQQELRSFEAIAGTLYEVGSGSQQAIISLQLEHNKLDLKLIRLEERLETHRQSLLALGAIESGDTLDVRTPNWPQHQENIPVSDGSQVNRPELARYSVLEAREEAVVARERASLWPEVRLQMTYMGISAADVPPSADGQDAFTIGVGARLPLWRERIHAKINRAEFQRRQIDLQREAFLVELERKLETVRAGFNATQSQLKKLREQLLPQAETTLETALSAYRTGQAGFLDLLDAQRSRFELRAREVDLMAEYEMLQAQLIREIGADPAVTQHQENG